MAQSTTLSSVGVSAAIALNPVAKSTTLILTLASSGTVSIEVSADDPSIPGGPTTTWALASSAVSMASSTLGSTLTGIIYTILSPVAQARIRSSSIVSGDSFTLKALQSVTA